MFSQSLATLLLLAAQAAAAPTTVQPLVGRSLVNATGPPPKGPNRYAALGASETVATLDGFFEEEKLVDPGMAVGMPLPASTSPSSPTEEPTALGSVFAEPTLKIKQIANPKNTRRPRLRYSKPTVPTPSAAPNAPAPPPPPPAPVGCFPSSRTTIPSTPTTADSLKQWWCDEKDDYAFMGFSYALYSCPSQSQMVSDFTRMKKEFGAKFVRIYAYCDESWMNNALVDAAATAGIGIYGLIW